MADYLSRAGHGEQVAALRIASLAMYQAETDSAYRLFPMLSEHDIREAQRTCPAVGKYLEACEAGKNMDKPSNNEARALWQARDRLTVLADGIVRYNNYKQRIVPWVKTASFWSYFPKACVVDIWNWFTIRL